MSTEGSPEARTKINARVGETCVFCEQVLVLPCFIASVSCDDWGVRIALEPLREQGFIYPKAELLNIAAAWGWGSFADDGWRGGQGAAWRLYFDDDLLRALREIASEVAQSDRMTRWERLAKRIAQYDVSGPDGIGRS